MNLKFSASFLNFLLLARPLAHLWDRSFVSSTLALVKRSSSGACFLRTLNRHRKQLGRALFALRLIFPRSLTYYNFEIPPKSRKHLQRANIPDAFPVLFVAYGTNTFVVSVTRSGRYYAANISASYNLHIKHFILSELGIQVCCIPGMI